MHTHIAASPRRTSTAVTVTLALLVGLAVGLGLAFLLAGGEEGSAATVPVSTDTSTRDGDPEAAAELPPIDTGLTSADATDPEQALRGFLAAEARRDHQASYDFLDLGSRSAAYPSPALWVNAHADVPQVTGYRIDAVEEVDADTTWVRTLTGFEAGVDPVLGLVPARGRTTWTLVRQDDGTWGVDAGATENRPLYPSSDGAAAAAQQWVEARRACEDTAALEADLVGSPALGTQLCAVDQPGGVTVGEIRSLVDADGATALLSEFGPEVYAWARVAPVDAATPLTLVLGPVGGSWQVVGILPRV